MPPTFLQLAVINVDVFPENFETLTLMIFTYDVTNWVVSDGMYLILFIICLFRVSPSGASCRHEFFSGG